ncbi:MAG: hypothetical protein IKX29_06375 [Bacteroidales bacterium]|nr:hypothetical protein [Bacteroidales bacterium]
MPANEYIQSVVNRTARPRSKRLRELGGTIVSTSASVVAGGGYSGAGQSHSHANLADLNRITVTDGYIYLTDEVIDPNTQDVTIETEKAMAGYADRAGANADGYTLDWFIPVTVDGVLTLKLNPIYAGLWSEGWISAGGVGSGGGAGGGSTVSVTQILTSGTSIATIAVDGVSTTIYAPSGGGTQVSWGTATGYVIPLTVGGTTKNLLLSGALTNYATQSWVTQQGYLTSSDLSGYATESWVNNKGYITNSALNGYATQAWVGQRGYLTSSDLSGYATENWVNNKGYITNSALNGYATQTWVGQQGYLTSSALSGYATESWVQQQGYATTVWIGEQGYLTALGYIGTTQVQASSGHQALAGITQIGLASSSSSSAPKGTLKPISLSGQSALVPKYGLRWTYQYLDQSSVNPTLQTVNKTIAFTDDIPTPKKLYFGSTSSGYYYDTTAQKVLTAALIGGVDLTSAQTIAGVKTFSDGIVGGDITVPQNKHIDIGPIRIEYDATNKALYITKADSSDTNTYGLHADGFITAGAANPNV